MSVLDLAGAEVVIVGGSSGIGLATAKMAREAGARVVIAARDPDRLEQARKEIGEGTRTFSLDVADEDAVAAMFEDIAQLDHLVVLAGGPLDARLVETDTTVLRRTMDVNFWGTLHSCKYAAPRMSPHGSITLCSGVATRRPPPARSVGIASRCAIEGFARALAVELGPIRVNTLCPGLVQTDLLDDFLGERRKRWVAEAVSKLPTGRMGDPDDAAHAIMFLMRNQHVTGITLRADGGYLLS